MPLTPYIIDAFAARLPKGDVREALSEMGRMPFTSLEVHDGYLKLEGLRLIYNADGVVDGNKVIGNSSTDRTIIIQRGLVQVSDVTKFNNTRLGDPTKNEAIPSASIEDLLYAYGCLGRIPDHHILQVTALKEALRIPPH